MRKSLNFNPGWLFSWGQPDGCFTEKFDDTDFYAVCLPHTVREEPLNCSNCKNYRGLVVYRKHFELSEGLRGKRLFLEFDGVMTTAKVWVNGRLLAVHDGGYLPFSVDMTEAVRLGSKNIVAVSADNRDDEDVPPGRNQAGLDFNYFGGIYRNVRLCALEDVHITDAVRADTPAGGGIFIRTERADRRNAQLSVAAQVENSGEETHRCIVDVRLLDRAGNEVAHTQSDEFPIGPGEKHTVEMELSADSPELWGPDNPYLYRTVVRVLCEGAPCDERTVHTGIRTFRFDAEQGFFLNGEKLVLNGANRHQEYAYVGYAMSDSLQYRDAVKLKEAGFNICRIGHYPNAPAFMDALDELGIMAIVPPPGWHWFKEEEPFLSRCYRNIREMIRWTRNHPCVVLWEPLLNESAMSEPFVKKCYDITHQEYPGPMCYAACDPIKSADYDVLYGWRAFPPKPSFSREYNDALEDQNYSALQLRDKQLAHFWTDRGAGGGYIGGERSELLVCRDREMSGVRSLNGHWGLVRKGNGFSGMCLWSFFDYNRGCQNKYAASGIMDLMRLPKFTFYLYASQRDPGSRFHAPFVDSGPFAHIVNYWTADSDRNVKVYSNCERVRLSLNGRIVGEQSPESGYDLPHPPFVFHNVPYEPGELKAEGLIDGRAAAVHTVHTPGKPARLALEPDFCGVPLTADGSDLVIIYARVLDKDGNLCTAADNRITFEIEGEGTIVGDGDARVGANPVRAMAGITGVLVRATQKRGKIRLTARADGLAPGSAVFSSRPCRTACLIGETQGHRPCPSTEPGYRPPEDDLYGHRTDWARGAAASASSSRKGHGPGLAVNGERVTRWLADGDVLPCYWQVDFGRPRNLTAAYLAWDNDRTFYTFDIAVSVDAKRWETMAHATQSGQDYMQALKFMAKDVRYCRITITGREGPGKTGLCQVRLVNSY